MNVPVVYYLMVIKQQFFGLSACKNGEILALEGQSKETEKKKKS